MGAPNILGKPVTEREAVALPFWEGAGEFAKIGNLCHAWWNMVQGWLEALPLQQDAATAPLLLVDLMAWQRDINRLAGEPESLYRLRVVHALANAQDAGSKAGFERIWQRLQIGYIGQLERNDATNWDVIQLEVSDGAISQNGALMDEIIRQFGRTCRRYTYTTVAPRGLVLRVFIFDNDTEFMVAT
ncbi:MAG: hypothetical protein RL095_2181 [Verrucomicrobiota bacterium]|jgi:hypothetical protein